jgi:hypothetical protein
MTERNAMQITKTLWHTQRIKRLIRERIGGGVTCLISVRETICTDPDCSGPATEIRITSMSLRESRLIIHKPASAVSRLDISVLD